jgi:hypothetical protein
MGRAAVRLLVNRLADPALPPQLALLPVTLAVRQSCGAAAGVAPPRPAPARRRRSAP